MNLDAVSAVMCSVRDLGYESRGEQHTTTPKHAQEKAAIAAAAYRNTEEQRDTPQQKAGDHKTARQKQRKHKGRWLTELESNKMCIYQTK